MKPPGAARKNHDMKHFLDIHTTDAAELRGMIDNAHAMKSARNNRPKGMTDDDQPLAGRMVALIFEKPSTRTRVSFDVGVRQMGGQTMVLSGKEMQLGHGETIADTARVLSRYVDLIMIRTFEEATLLEMAEHATVPVINGLTNRTHPCQIMADVMTYEEHRGAIGGRKFVWSGDGNNVCTSWLHAAGQFGIIDEPLQGARRYREPDPVARAHIGQRSAHRGLRRRVQHDRSEGRAAHAAVRDSHGVLHALPEQLARNGEGAGLGHAGRALGADVLQHQDIAGFDIEVVAIDPLGKIGGIAKYHCPPFVLHQ